MSGADMQKAPECVIVCQQSVDCGAWPNGACETACGQAVRAAYRVEALRNELAALLYSLDTNCADGSWLTPGWDVHSVKRVLRGAISTIAAPPAAQAEPRQIQDLSHTIEFADGMDDELPPFEDPSVQIAYSVLSEAPQPWDHFTARRVVAALAQQVATPASFVAPEWFAHG